MFGLVVMEGMTLSGHLSNIKKSNPAGLNLEFEMSVLSDLGGHWDVFFLNEVIA